MCLRAGENSSRGVRLELCSPASDGRFGNNPTVLGGQYCAVSVVSFVDDEMERSLNEVNEGMGRSILEHRRDFIAYFR